MSINYVDPENLPDAEVEYLWYCRWDCAPMGSVCAFQVTMDRSHPDGDRVLIHHLEQPVGSAAARHETPYLVAELEHYATQQADIVRWFASQGWHAFRCWDHPQTFPYPHTQRIIDARRISDGPIPPTQNSYSTGGFRP